MIDIERIRLKDKIQKEKESREKILNKINSLNLVLGYLSIPLDVILNRYEGMLFRDTTLSKKEVFTQALRYDLTKENKEYLTVQGSKVSSHQNDKRTHSDYCIDLILGWATEDAVLSCILLEGIEARLQGMDSEREFLKQSELGTDPDIIIGSGDNKRMLEVVCDWTDHWKNSHKLDLRDNKFLRLVKENSLLLGLSPSGLGFLITPAEKMETFTYNPRIFGYGNKQGYTNYEVYTYLKPIDQVLNELYNIFKNN